MDSAYATLAARLDELPHGYPATPDGVELRLLAKIFSPDDARLAAQLLPVPQTAGAIAVRLGVDATELAGQLDRMAGLGQIMLIEKNGVRRYSLVPFVVGIYEFQLPRMDAELAALFEEYAPVLLRTLGGSKPALARVVPVNARIDARAQVLEYEDVRGMIERAHSIRLSDCICRKERAAHGAPCRHETETCLSFAAAPDALESFPTWGRTISRDEALDVLKRAERAGLVHCTYNIERDSLFVCNCCRCCCGFLRGVSEHHAPHLLVRSNFVAAIDDQLCSVCGACLKDRCPVDAIELADGRPAILGERCIGCGVCNVACAKKALRLVARPRSQRTRPPRNIMTWSFSRAAHRSGPLHAVALMARYGLSSTRKWNLGARRPRA